MDKIVIMKKIGYKNNYIVIIPDHGAGREDRYTVYSIPSSPSRQISTIGKELTLNFILDNLSTLKKEI